MSKHTPSRFMAAAAGVALLASGTGALAHHSAIQFDFTRQVPIKGVVKEFAAINPHMRLVLDVTTEAGKHEMITFEGHSTNNMYRSGYRKGMVQVGDAITVNVAPLKNGTLGGYVVSAETAKGESFGMRSRSALSAEELRKQAEGK